MVKIFWKILKRYQKDFRKLVVIPVVAMHNSTEILVRSGNSTEALVKAANSTEALGKSPNSTTATAVHRPGGIMEYGGEDVYDNNVLATNDTTTVVATNDYDLPGNINLLLPTRY